jgi:hypothetical protein
MARPKTTKTDEPMLHEEDAMVDIHFAAGDLTTDLHTANGTIKFIDGVARVPQALADDLRAKGYVK